MPEPNPIRVARERLGISQVYLSERAGIHPVTLCRLEAGKHKPHGATLRVLAEILGVDAEDLRT